MLTAAAEVGRTFRSLTGSASPMVVVELPVSVDAVVILLAATLSEFSVCFLDPASPLQRRAAVHEALAPDLLVDSKGRHVLARARDSGRRDDECGYVAMSSGSTGGPPKGVLSTWSALAAFAPDGAAALELDADAAWAETSHPAFDMAMTNLVLALASGSAIHVSSALSDRLRPLRFLDRVGATHVRLGARFIDLACSEKRPAPHTMRVWGSGGDRLLAGQARGVFALGVPTVINTYGTSETAGFTSAFRLAATDTVPTLHDTVTIGGGRVGAWSADVVRDGDRDVLSIHGKHLPSGYLFGAGQDDYPRWLPGGSVLTGDTGARVGGDLYCLGRSGRRVKRHGLFVDLDQVDASIRGAGDWMSFTVLREDGCLVSLVETTQAGIEQLRGVLPSVLRPDVLPDLLQPLPVLPRLENGKVDQAAAAMLADVTR